MKKNLFLLALGLWCSAMLFAGPRTLQEAEQIAAGFNGNTGMTSRSTAVTVELAHTQNGTDQPLYYVFNKGTGFVIVSADDRATEILGYSDAGSFDMDNLPENFRSWLGNYAAELEQLAATPEVAGIELSTATAQTRSTGQTLEPLLGSIIWNQSDPYNTLCPTIGGVKAPAGCVATAMAQIMRYHRWPEKGTGTIPGYTTQSGIKINSENISTTTYDWANMTPVYTSSSTRTEKKAVATLMYHCGIGVQMNYDASASGASSYSVGPALINYFSYNPNMEYLSRIFYSKAEWDSIVRKELNEGRPMYYDGAGEGGAHAFVCDGYDANGLYHFNWGWGGTSNGYFALSALNPSSQGIGGNLGGFNSNQGVLVGIGPQTTEARKDYQIHMDTTMEVSSTQISRTGTFDIAVKNILNYGIRTFNGVLGAALYDTSGNIVCLLQGGNVSISTGYGYQSLPFEKVQIPNSVQPGNYRLHIVYKAQGSSDYYPCRTIVGTPNYVDVTISSSQVTFGSATGFDVDLQLDELAPQGNIYQDSPCRISYTVTNNGAEYASILAVYMVSVSDENVYQMGALNPVSIAHGETQTFEVTETFDELAPGEYYLYLICDPDNNILNLSRGVTVGDSVLVNVLAAPTGTPNLLATDLSFGDNSNVNRGDMNLTATVTNRGDYFSGRMIAFIFSLTSSASSDYIGLQQVILDAGETQEMTFNGAVSLDEGTYRVALFYDNNGWTRASNYLNFTLVAPTALSTPMSENGAVYPNPAQDVLHVRMADKITDLCVHDLSGRLLLRLQPETDGEIQVPVAHLQAGTYMLLVRTNEGVSTTKFIKK